MAQSLKPSNPRVSIVILNWNGLENTIKCLDSLKVITYPSYEVIVVDNDSKEDEGEALQRKYCGYIKLIKNAQNFGFAQGCNKGISLARGEYVFVLNNDTRIDKNCLGMLIEVAERNSQIGMVAPKIMSMRNQGLIDSVGINIYLDGMSRGRGRMEEDKGQYDQVEEILLPSGCAALYRKKMLDEIGLFDEDFFAYCEDTDLGLRGRLAGWKSALVSSAIVYHYYSGTVGEYSDFKAFLIERNHFWVAFKNFPLFLLFLLPFYTVWRYCFIICGVLIQRGPGSKSRSSKLELFFILIKAYYSVLKEMPQILKKRKLIQKSKKLTDKEIYSLFKKHSLGVSEFTLKD